MRTRPTAGQATVEYLAALALIAALFVVAAPAVGAPNLGKIVVHKLRLAICIVAGDVCTNDDAEAAGLNPCPLSSQAKGDEASVTIFSVEVGGRWLLTITPKSDGSVSVVRTLGASVGASRGGWDFSAGPVSVSGGLSGTARNRVQGALGWDFPNGAAARKFLKHAFRNEFRLDEFPPSWGSVEAGAEFSAQVGLSLGSKSANHEYEVFGSHVSTQGALGLKVARDSGVTVYGRVAGSAGLTLPLVPGMPNYSGEWVAEYTHDKGAPRQLAFRQSVPSGNGQTTDTVARLDLRDPANAAVAKSILTSAFPWPPSMVGRVKGVLAYIAEHGTIERTVSSVDDDSAGVSAHGTGPYTFGLSYRHTSIKRKLVSATARTGGPYERERFDCVR